MDTDASQRIYNEFIRGRVINKKWLAGGHLVENPLYFELASSQNRPHYDELYSRIGYELKELEDCFFLNEIEKDDILTGSAMEVQALLVILVQGSFNVQLSTDSLKEHAAGFGKAHLKEIGGNVKYKGILRAAGLENGFVTEIERSLIERKLAYWNDQEKLVLSSGGAALLDHLLAGHWSFEGL